MGKFNPPTIQEIKQFSAQIGYPRFDAEEFWLFYDQKDWMVGKSKMKKWRSAVRLWIRRDPVKYPPPKPPKESIHDNTEEKVVPATAEQKAEFHRKMRKLVGKMRPNYGFLRAEERAKRVQKQKKQLMT